MQHARAFVYLNLYNIYVNNAKQKKKIRKNNKT